MIIKGLTSHFSYKKLNIQFVTVPLEKEKKHLRLQGGGSEIQKLLSAGLPLPMFFRNKGVALIWGLCG